MGMNMKTLRNIAISTAALAAAALQSACDSSVFEAVKGGSAIVFTAGTGGSEYSDTRAEYGGTFTDTDSKRKDSIKWSAGDVLRIYCAQADEPASLFADYRIDSTASGDRTKADISLNSATTAIGLRWNNDENMDHTFYAVFPSPSDSGICTGILEDSIAASLAVSQNTLSGAMKGSAAAGYVLSPDLKWQLMTAGPETYKRANFPSKGTVFMNFTPLTTAIQFTITNAASNDNDLVIKEVDLISEGTQIAGKFKIPNVTDRTGSFPKVSGSGASPVPDSEKTVKLEFGDITIKKGKTFTFTFFLAPVSDVQDLKFRIVRGGADDGATMTTRLGYTDGTYVKFSRCKKSFVTGIMVPEGVQWTIDYEPFLTNWIGDGGEDVTLN